MIIQDILLRSAVCMAIVGVSCRFLPERFGISFAVSRSLHAGLGINVFLPLLLLVASGVLSFAALVLWYYKLTFPIRM